MKPNSFVHQVLFLITLHYITLCYTTFHSLDPSLGKMTVGSGLCHLYIYIAIEDVTQENTVVTYKAV